MNVTINKPTGLRHTLALTVLVASFVAGGLTFSVDDAAAASIHVEPAGTPQWATAFLARCDAYGP